MKRITPQEIGLNIRKDNDGNLLFDFTYEELSCAIVVKSEKAIIDSEPVYSCVCEVT